MREYVEADNTISTLRRTVLIPASWLVIPKPPMMVCPSLYFSSLWMQWVMVDFPKRDVPAAKLRFTF